MFVPIGSGPMGAGSADGALTVNRIGEEAALVGGGSGAKPGGNAKAVTPRGLRPGWL